MGPTTSGAAFAAANAAMIRGVDAASTVHVLLAQCLQLLDVDTAGVLVRVGEHELQLLAATSHQAASLELYQSQTRRGPCVDAIQTGRPVTAAGAGELAGRWPDFARAMTAAGLHTVHALPMRWHHRVLGGMNLFGHDAGPLTPEEQELAQAFADICTLALMQPATAEDPAQESTAVTEKLRAALRGRVAIERAKGVLAQTHHLDMGEAFAHLVQISQQTGQPLAQTAHTILHDIVTPRP